MSEVLAKEYPNVCLRVMYRRRSPPTVDRKALFAIIVPPAVHRLEPARAAPLCADLRWRDADTQQCSSVIDGPKRRRWSSAERPAGVSGEHRSGECNGPL